jgi:phage I-like protein
LGNFNYIIDLAGLQLSEGRTWLHAMPVGEYSHPVWGKIPFTPERLFRFADNVKNRVRGIDPDIDYDHKQDPAKGNKAAGWIKGAEARGDGLWIDVEFTNEAIRAINEKEYKYLSPEFKDEWAHERTGQKYKDVLFGAALTNRPFLKDLLPITMAEIGPLEPVRLSEADRQAIVEEAVQAMRKELAEDSRIHLMEEFLTYLLRKEDMHGLHR